MCKSCNYTALTGEVRLNYTPVAQAESRRRQVELQACLCNRGECEEWQRPETGAEVQQLSERFTGRREESPPSFTLFSKLQEQIVWGDTHNKWHGFSDTEPLLWGCLYMSPSHQMSSVDPPSASLFCIPVRSMSSLLPSKAEEVHTRACLCDFCIHVWLSLGSRSGYICFNSERNSEI